MAESHREEIAKLESLYAGNPGGRVFVHLAEAYRKAGEHERARRILEEGLARHTDSASGYVVLGRVLADMQITAEAETAFRRVLELDGGNLVALRWLGDLARQAGRNTEAAAHYRELLVRNPSNEEVRDLVEIVEREAAGIAAPATEAEPAATETRLAIDTGDAAAVSEPVSEAEAPAVEAPAQAGTLDEEDVSPWSAAPGRTDDAEESPVEYGLVDIAAAGPTPAEPEPHPAEVEADLVTRFDEEEAELEPQELPREDEAEPIGIHLLDPAWEESEAAGEPADEVVGEIDLSDLATLEQEPEPVDELEDVTLDLAELAEEEESAGEYADDEFLADLMAAGPEEPAAETLDGATLDVLDDGSPLTLLDEEASATEEPPAEPTFGMNEAALSDLAGATEPAAEEDVEPAPADRGWTFVEEPEPVAPREPEPVAAAAPAPEPVETAPEPIFPAAPPAPEPPPEEEYTLEVVPEPAEEEPAAPQGEPSGRAEPPARAEPAARAEPPVRSEPPGRAGPPTRVEPTPAAAAPRRPAGLDTGLMTETMALLYRSQGFHDRAAEVYRALLRTRPDDERLRARLREAEEAVAAAAEPRAAPTPSEEESGDVWLRGVGAPWTAAAGEVPVDATPYAWTETEETEQGEAIGSYLQDLVSWKPGLGRWGDAAMEAQPLRPPESSSMPSWMEAPDSAEVAPAPESDPWADAAIEELSSWAPPSGARTPADAIPEDPWLQAPPGGAEPAEAAEAGWTPLELEAEADVSDVQVPANTPPPAQHRPEPDEEEDEDLEMFRSWLQSLKK